jgi:hypothetical protein
MSGGIQPLYCADLARVPNRISIREQYLPSNFLELGVNTFFRHLQLSALCDLDWLGWLVA